MKTQSASKSHERACALVDASFGPGRALRGVWTSRGQHSRVARRLPTLSPFASTGYTGSKCPAAIQRNEWFDRIPTGRPHDPTDSHKTGSSESQGIGRQDTLPTYLPTYLPPHAEPSRQSALPQFLLLMEQQGRFIPGYVQREFDDYLKCGRLEYGFLRVRCEDCHHARLVAFSCKHRGICPSCGARRMVESAALLVDDVLPYQPIRQWVLSFPFPLRFLLARYPSIFAATPTVVLGRFRAVTTNPASLLWPEPQYPAMTCRCCTPCKPRPHPA